MKRIPPSLPSPASSRRTLNSFLVAVLLGFAGPSPAQLLLGPGKELLDPEKAFRISVRALDGRNIEVEFQIADGYYMYRDRFSFATESGKPLAEVEIPRGTVTSQGCADAGVCYLPLEQTVRVTLPRAKAS